MREMAQTGVPPFSVGTRFEQQVVLVRHKRHRLGPDTLDVRVNLTPSMCPVVEPGQHPDCCCSPEALSMIVIAFDEKASAYGTGYMSNRGRQNVASYLALDLGIDWREGADWFESLLVDYDVCSNWGESTHQAIPHWSPRAWPPLRTFVRKHDPRHCPVLGVRSKVLPCLCWHRYSHAFGRSCEPFRLMDLMTRRQLGGCGGNDRRAAEPVQHREAEQRLRRCAQHAFCRICMHCIQVMRPS